MTLALTDSHPAAVHFVGFRGEEYWSAVKVWGLPDFIHRWWDKRARREIAAEVNTPAYRL